MAQIIALLLLVLWISPLTNSPYIIGPVAFAIVVHAICSGSKSRPESDEERCQRWLERRLPAAATPQGPAAGTGQVEPTGRGHCPVCRLEIESPNVCPTCSTPHHADCWQYNGGCAVYACGSRAKQDVWRPACPRCHANTSVGAVDNYPGLYWCRCCSESIDARPPTPAPASPPQRNHQPLLHGVISREAAGKVGGIVGGLVGAALGGLHGTQHGAHAGEKLLTTMVTTEAERVAEERARRG